MHQKKTVSTKTPVPLFCFFFCFFFLEHGTRCPFLCLRVCVCRFLFLLFFNFALFYFVLWPFRPRWTGGSPLGPTLKRDFVIDAIYGHRWHRRVLPFIRTRVGRVAESRVFCFVWLLFFLPSCCSPPVDFERNHAISIENRFLSRCCLDEALIESCKT